MSNHHPSLSDYPCPVAPFKTADLSMDIPGLYLFHAANSSAARQGDLLSSAPGWNWRRQPRRATMIVESESLAATVLLEVSVTPLMWVLLHRASTAAGGMGGHSNLNDLVVEAINKELLRLQSR